MSVPGGGWLGPQVNKFEQVSSDDHQMSVAGRDPQIGCLGWGEGSPGLMSGGRGTLPCALSNDACDVGQTDACESDTFPQLRFGKKNILCHSSMVFSAMCTEVDQTG